MTGVKLSVAAQTSNYKGKSSGHLTPTIDYRRGGAGDGQLPVSVERAGEAAVITIDLGAGAIFRRQSSRRRDDRQRDSRGVEALVASLIAANHQLCR
jgi:hypothetical protein